MTVTMADHKNSIHRFEMRVYFEDTDVGGIVYYANYLRFAERGRTEMLRQSGFKSSELIRLHNAALAVRHCAVDYLQSARLDDVLVVETEIIACKGAALDLKQRVLCGDIELVVMDVRLAYIDLDRGRAKRLPENLRKNIVALMKTQ